MARSIRHLRPVLLLFLLACAAGVVALPLQPAAAQESTTRGLNLGLHLQGASLKVEDGEQDGGGGLGFRVGYGFNRIITAYVEVDGIEVEAESADVFQGTWSLGHADLGVRFHFANALRSWVPFLELAVGGRFASVSDVEADGQRFEDVSFSGGSFSFGGGLDVYLSRTLALDVGLKVSGGEFTEVDIGPVSLNNLDIDATSTRFKVGIVWWP